MFTAQELFDLSQTEHATLFGDAAPAWGALPRLKDYLEATLESANSTSASPQAVIGKNVFLGKGTTVAPGACIEGPAFIGRNCQIRHGAYVRANVIIGDGCVIGNSSEVKNSLLFNDCHVPHFNYVGDSILGHHAHLGAGVILSNLKSIPSNVMVGGLDTGLRKFGALIGDRAELGCNSVLSPGSIIGRDCVIYPNICWRGVLPARHIVKNRGQQEVVEQTSRSQ